MIQRLIALIMFFAALASAPAAPPPAEPASTAPGVKGEYFLKPDLTSPLFTRLEHGPAFPSSEFLTTPEGKIAVAARYTATLTVPKTGDYTFHTHADDQVTITIDGTTVVTLDTFQQASTKAALKAGTFPLVVEYRNTGGGGMLAIDWEGPGLKRQPFAGNAFAVKPWPHMPPHEQEAFNLDKDWKKSRLAGLRGTYFEGAKFDKQVHEQIDPSIDIPGNYPIPSGRIENISVRWSGVLDVPADGDYTLTVSSDDSFALYLDHQRIIQQGCETRTHKLTLTKGPHPVRIEHVQGAGEGYLRARWSGPGFKDQPFGKGMLYTRPWKDAKPPQPMLVFLMFGHSNMDGRAQGMKTFHPRTWTWNAEHNRWSHVPEDNSPMGPFLKALAEAHPDVHFGAFKVAIGAATFDNAFLPGKRGYASLIQSAKPLNDAYPLGGIVSMIGWCEGGEQSGKPRRFGEDYVTTLDAFRKDLADAALPLIASQIEVGNPDKSEHASWKMVHAAIADLPRYRTGVLIVPSNKHFRDTHHYSPKGYETWAADAVKVIKEAKLVDTRLAEKPLKGALAEAPAVRDATAATVEAKLLKLSKPRSVKDLGTYKDSLITAHIDITRILEGKTNTGKAVVLLYGIRDRKPQPLADLKPGTPVTLELTPWEARRDLHSIATDDDILDFSSPQYFTPQIKKAEPAKADSAKK